MGKTVRIELHLKNEGLSRLACGTCFFEVHPRDDYCSNCGCQIVKKMKVLSGNYHSLKKEMDDLELEEIVESEK